MDYVPGGVAALITGNVTPNRPRLVKRALTPTKHQPSPNVTPKSELVDDRSIFLSPTLQKKKAIVKKSPKRIFENPNLDITDNDDSTPNSLKAEKVKKHLKEKLDTDTSNSKSSTTSSPKMKNMNDTVKNVMSNEGTPIKKKKRKNVDKILNDNIVDDVSENKLTKDEVDIPKSPKKKKNSLAKIERLSLEDNNQQITQDIKIKQSSNKKRKKKTKAQANKEGRSEENDNPDNKNQINNKENHGNSFSVLNDKKKLKNKKRNKKGKIVNKVTELMEADETVENNQDNTDKDTTVKDTNITKEKEEQNDRKNKGKKKKSKKKGLVNPNAITNKDSDSEHESDNEIESENEKINNKILDKEPTDSTSDEDEVSQKPEKKEKEKNEDRQIDPNELKRTLFVGNVPFSKKCKKEIKKIFNKYGQIETVRIRTVPVKDARDTPKLAIIKNELHPERSTVNVYVKFANADSVEKALVENNAVLNEHHLRVSRSESTGAEHDPRCSVFVGNLPFALEDEALRAKFENCGEIDSVRIIRDKKTNAGKGFGYVNFKSKDGVELALALSEEDLTIKNRIIRVKRCMQNAQKQGNKLKKGNQFGPRGDRPQGRFQGNRQGGSYGGEDSNQPEGAYKRIMNKRKYQDNAEQGPPNKRQNTNQPRKEKKERKDFVGITAEKRKKQKFDKGQKKKKILSEILTK